MAKKKPTKPATAAKPAKKEAAPELFIVTLDAGCARPLKVRGDRRFGPHVIVLPPGEPVELRKEQMAYLHESDKVTVKPKRGGRQTSDD